MTYIVYDETANLSNTIGGYGLLSISEKEADIIIQEALNNLKKDPDINNVKTKDRDDATIKRGYFHACEDSQNAHSHLSNSINKHLNGKFSCFFQNKTDDFNTTIKQQKESLNNVSLDLFYSKDELSIIFEGRGGISKDSMKKWYDELSYYVLAGLYIEPHFEANFPKVNIEIGDKNNSSIQICDYLLWTALGNYENKKTWWSRLSPKEKIETKLPSNWIEYDLYFGMYNDPQLQKYNDIRIELDEIKYSELLNGFTFIKQFLREIEFHLPVQCMYLADEIHSLNRIRTLSDKYIAKCVLLALKLLDTSNYVDGKSDDEIKSFLLLKRQLAYLLCKEEGLEARNFIQECYKKGIVYL